ncbi:MAG: porin family protein [Bacteroidetes bacterium]|nr:porin family protein [Bacteroidota bacterium]MBL7104565.1 porin family protein [Bacteroidales bacterium]
MKNKINLTTVATIFLGIIVLQTAHSQCLNNDMRAEIRNMWSINVNAGLTSYFGDLSIYDSKIGNKLTKESGPAFGAILTKHINNKFGISGQLLYGNLKSTKNNVSFKSKLFEYNLHARVNFISLFSPCKQHNFGIVGYAGIGQFLVETTKYKYSDGYTEIIIHNSSVPEFVYFFGVGIYYKVADKIGITADLALRQCRNDRLDDYVKNNNYDYYSFLNIGVTYYINTLINPPRKKNKANIVCSGAKLKKLKQ